MRYASLHRSIESGIANDRTWSEMVQVCVELQRTDEALRAFDRIENRALRQRMQDVLRRKGVATHTDEEKDERRPARAPEVCDADTLIEQITDGFRFLFVDHMPLTVIVATVTFPLVVGLGGFLTAGSHFFLFPAIALIPALSVIGLVGALGRRILLDASRGLDDPPSIPAARELAREAGRFLLDGAALSGVFLGPAILMMLLPFVTTGAIMLAFVVGATLLPMAFALRQVRDDWKALNPGVLFPAVVRGGRLYLLIVAVALGLFAPAIVSGLLTSGSHLYMTLSVIGPLAVAPLLIVSRLLGQMLFARRFDLAPATPAGSATAPARAASPAVGAATGRAKARNHPLRSASHPEAAHRPANAPATGPTSKQATKPAGQPRAKPADPSQRPQAQPSARKPQTPAAGPAPAAGQARGSRFFGKASRPQPAPAPERQPSGPVAKAPRTTPAARPGAPRRTAQQPAAPAARGKAIVGEAIPDLTRLPGVSVVTGDERRAAGAAAGTRR